MYTRRSIRLALTLLLALCAPPSWAENDVDINEGGSSAALLVTSYDPAESAGLLLSLDEEGQTQEVIRHKGEVCQRIYEVVGDIPYALALWRPIDKVQTIHPEVWSIPGYPSLEWGGLPRYSWVDAEVIVRPGKRGIEVWVNRSLVGENDTLPHLRCKEKYLLTERSLVLLKQSTGKIKTPEQMLNLIHSFGEQQENEKMVAAVKKLPRKPAKYLQRAVILLSRFGKGAAVKNQSKQLLEMMATHSNQPDVVTKATNRLLEMAWEEARAGKIPPSEP